VNQRAEAISVWSTRPPAVPGRLRPCSRASATDRATPGCRRTQLRDGYATSSRHSRTTPTRPTRGLDEAGQARVTARPSRSGPGRVVAPYRQRPSSPGTPSCTSTITAGTAGCTGRGCGFRPPGPSHLGNRGQLPRHMASRDAWRASWTARIAVMNSPASSGVRSTECPTSRTVACLAPSTLWQVRPAPRSTASRPGPREEQPLAGWRLVGVEQDQPVAARQAGGAVDDQHLRSLSRLRPATSGRYDGAPRGAGRTAPSAVTGRETPVTRRFPHRVRRWVTAVSALSGASIARRHRVPATHAAEYCQGVASTRSPRAWKVGSRGGRYSVNAEAERGRRSGADRGHPARNGRCGNRRVTGFPCRTAGWRGPACAA